MFKKFLEYFGFISKAVHTVEEDVKVVSTSVLTDLSDVVAPVEKSSKKVADQVPNNVNTVPAATETAVKKVRKPRKTKRTAD